MYRVPVFRFPPGALMGLPEAIQRGEVRAWVMTVGPNLVVQLA